MPKLLVQVNLLSSSLSTIIISLVSLPFKYVLMSTIVVPCVHLHYKIRQNSRIFPNPIPYYTHYVRITVMQTVSVKSKTVSCNFKEQDICGYTTGNCWDSKLLSYPTQSEPGGRLQ